MAIRLGDAGLLMKKYRVAASRGPDSSPQPPGSDSAGLCLGETLPGVCEDGFDLLAPPFEHG